MVNQWGAISMIRLQKTVSSTLLAPPLSGALCSLALVEQAGRAHMARTEGSLWTTTSKDLRLTVRQPSRDPIRSITVEVRLQAYSSPAETLDEATDSDKSLIHAQIPDS